MWFCADFTQCGIGFNDEGDDDGGGQVPFSICN